MLAEQLDQSAYAGSIICAEESDVRGRILKKWYVWPSSLTLDFGGHVPVSNKNSEGRILVGTVSNRRDAENSTK